MVDKSYALFKQLAKDYADIKAEADQLRSQLNDADHRLQTVDQKMQQSFRLYDELVNQLAKAQALTQSIDSLRDQQRQEEEQLQAEKDIMDADPQLANNMQSVQAEIKLLHSKRERTLAAVDREVEHLLKSEQLLEEDDYQEKKRQLAQLEQEARQEQAVFDTELAKLTEEFEAQFNAEHERRVQEQNEFKRQLEQQNSQHKKQLEDAEIRFEHQLKQAEAALAKETALLNEICRDNLNRGRRRVTFDIPANEFDL